AHDAERARARTVREVTAEFRGLSGTAKQKVVLEATGLARAPLSGLIRGRDLDGAALARWLTAMQAASKPVRQGQLGVVRREQGAARVDPPGRAMDTFKYDRKTRTTDGA